MARVFEPDGVFQFTPLREGRPRHPHSAVHQAYFNSRPSARGDPILRANGFANVFQFTPLREGRRASVRRKNSAQQKNFNSRPSARGDAFSLVHCPSPHVFQFTPLREGRQEGESDG